MIVLINAPSIYTLIKIVMFNLVKVIRKNNVGTKSLLIYVYRDIIFIINNLEDKQWRQKKLYYLQ